MLKFSEIVEFPKEKFRKIPILKEFEWFEWFEMVRMVRSLADRTFQLWWKWHGGLATNDGHLIFGFPNHADTVLKIDTRTDAVSLLGGPDILKSGRHRVPQDKKYKYLGGAMAADGRVYLFPCDAERVLCIDPVTASYRNDSKSRLASRSHTANILVPGL